MKKVKITVLKTTFDQELGCRFNDLNCSPSSQCHDVEVKSPQQ